MNQSIAQILPSQLPEYIRSDSTYSKFVAFMQAYYEWMETENHTLFQTRNLLTYDDIDKTSADFLKYFTQDFIPLFPDDCLVDKSLAVKIAKELYKSKGTPASYQFLFRILFNSEVDIFYTKEAILKASNGSWYVAKSLKLATIDPRFLNIQNLRAFGEISKSLATIETSVISGNKTEVFISNIERLFQSGEPIRILDSKNQDVIINGSNLRATLVGQINQIKIDPNHRGLLYKTGDPVIVYNGLNPTILNPVEAIAAVGTTTNGSIKGISVNKQGFGYTSFPNTLINITNSIGAKAIVGSLTSTLMPPILISNGGNGYKINDSVIKGTITNNIIFADVTNVDTNGSIIEITYRNAVDANTILGISANVISTNSQASNAVITISNLMGTAFANATYIVKDTIDLKIQELHVGHASGYLLGNTNNPVAYNFAQMPSANINTKLSDAFSFESFPTYAISSVSIENGGVSTSLPSASVDSTYITDVFNPLDAANTLGQNIQGNLSSLGILAPIQIITQGSGYQVNDKIVFSGGSGYGAFANVTAVNITGGITKIDYVFPSATIQYPLGGMGFKEIALPNVSISPASNTANGATILVPGILGTGAELSLSVDRIGAITTINVLEFGEDYNSAPDVSLKVQDIVVANVSLSNLPKKNDIIYQGTTLNTASYVASVNSISLLSSFGITSQYNLRVFNYNSTPKPQQKLKIANSVIQLDMVNSSFPENFFFFGSPAYDSTGVKIYGDGNAKANATFLNGLTISQGEYLNTQGQLSSFSVLQGNNYNNFTYQLTVEKEIAKYREFLLSLLHPVGMKVIGRYAIKSNSAISFNSESSFFSGKSLAAYTGFIGSSVSISGSFTNKSNNIVQFNNLAGANLSTFITTNNTIKIYPINGGSINSDVTSVDYVNNIVTLKENTWVTFANVAYISGNINSPIIHINSLTDAFDIVNNGNYSNTQNYLTDIIFVGDNVKINNNTYIVSTIDYQFNNVTLTSNLTISEANTLITLNKTLLAGGSSLTQNQVIILGPVGLQYIPEITTESGFTLITESGDTILLG